MTRGSRARFGAARLGLAGLLGAVGCAGGGGGGVAAALGSPVCREAGPVATLPPEARESSGVAPAAGGAGAAGPIGGTGAASYWTHNDSGWPAELIRVGPDGSLLDRVRVTGADNVDWEDMAAGPCGGGPAGSGAGPGRCLYLADTGDNDERREALDLYRVREPAPGATRTGPAERLQFRLPHGPRDIEALLLLDPETALLVSKGRSDPVEVYLVTWPASGAGVQEARLVQVLTSGPPGWRGVVTGGAAVPAAEGGWIVALRTYQSLRFFRVRDASGAAGAVAAGPLEAVPGSEMSLVHLREPQGEAVGFAGGGRVVLTSEGGPLGGPASLRELDCSVGFGRWGVTPVVR